MASLRVWQPQLDLTPDQRRSLWNCAVFAAALAAVLCLWIAWYEVFWAHGMATERRSAMATVVDHAVTSDGQVIVRYAFDLDNGTRLTRRRPFELHEMAHFLPTGTLEVWYFASKPRFNRPAWIEQDLQVHRPWRIAGFTGLGLMMLALLSYGLSRARKAAAAPPSMAGAGLRG